MFCFLWAKVEAKDIKLKKGDWSASLQLNEKDNLPFRLIININKHKTELTVCNGSEKIVLSQPIKKGDSLDVSFPTFNSKIIFKIKNSKNIDGYWINYNKNSNYKLPFTAKFGYINRFENTTKTINFSNINGKWKTVFDPNTQDEYFAIGLFQQNNQIITGTFLTETGDYRFLEGNQYGNQFKLSCFDGSHAFLFTAELNNDTLRGHFLSGKHFKGEWYATKNESFELRDAYQLTQLKNEKQFQFDLKDVDGNDFHFPNSNFKNKVVIVQIMGTWCPNCMDETKYFKELYEKYHDKGLEIITVGYEVGSDFNEYAQKIKLLKERLNLNFTFLVGGKASKDLASQQFSMLNQIMSFPTSIYIDKKGVVRNIHTGFNGPGTGSYYTEYVKKTDTFIQQLLNDE